MYKTILVVVSIVAIGCFMALAIFNQGISLPFGWKLDEYKCPNYGCGITDMDTSSSGFPFLTRLYEGDIYPADCSDCFPVRPLGMLSNNFAKALNIIFYLISVLFFSYFAYKFYQREKKKAT